MRTKKSWLNILSFSLLFTAMPALASDCHTINHDQSQYFRDLLVKANININDTRVNGSESDFEAEELANLAAITGTVTCRSGDYVSKAKARLYQDENVLMTSGHVFVDKSDDKIKANARRINERNLPKCTFASKSNPGEEIDLKLDHPGNYKFGTTNPLFERTLDYAFVKLAKPVPAKWIPEFSSTGPQPDETLYLVTTDAKGSAKQIDPNQLVVQKCSYQFGDGRENVGFFNDCSTLRGDSFGVYYAKREGEWKAVAFQVATGEDSANGLPFDFTNPDPNKRSFSFGAGFSTKFTLDGIEFQRRSSGQADAAGGRKVNSVSPNKS